MPIIALIVLFGLLMLIVRKVIPMFIPRLAQVCSLAPEQPLRIISVQQMSRVTLPYPEPMDFSGKPWAFLPEDVARYTVKEEDRHVPCCAHKDNCECANCCRKLMNRRKRPKLSTVTG